MREEHAQVQPKIDEGGYIFGQQEQILWHIYLGKDVRVCHQGVHAAVGGLPVVGEHQVAAEQVDGVMGGVPAEKLGKYQTHHQQIQQRRQYAPVHAQNGALVFLLEVPFDQLGKKKLAFINTV